jgi:hypothetical protein
MPQRLRHVRRADAAAPPRHILDETGSVSRSAMVSHRCSRLFMLRLFRFLEQPSRR